MTLTPIGGGSAHQRATEFARRGPWGGLLCAVWKLNKTTQGTYKDLTRRWAHGPANYLEEILFESLGFL